MLKRCISALLASSIAFSTLPVITSYAAEAEANNSVSGYISLTDGIKLAGQGKTTKIYVDSADEKSVIRAVGDLKDDLKTVTDVTAEITNQIETANTAGTSGIVIGESSTTMNLEKNVDSDADAYIAAYNHDGTLSKVIKADKGIGENGGQVSGFEFNTVIEKPAGGKIKGFVWKDMEPVADVQKLYSPYEVVLDGVDIVIGTIGESKAIDTLALSGDIDTSAIEGEWEAFTVQSVDNTIVIAGSDKRGTIYGVYDLCEKIGVSPWTFWADATPVHADNLYVNLPPEGYTEGASSVKYRGIFLNDEYNLNQWSKSMSSNGTAMTHETYEKIFELILRLKANYLWPAMHKYSPSFHSDEENARLADEYGIVMGSSHSEPLLRNNLGELDGFQSKWETEHPDKTLYKALKNESGNSVAYYWTDHDGDGNAVDNKEFLEDYWRESVKNNGSYENIYTLGMRGVHDGSFQTNMDKATALNEIITTQRKILKEEIADKQGIALEDIPQVFIPYKDVLAYYNDGSLKIPDDVTIMWTNDNYGYMRQNANDAERARSGRTGVYYHISYYGYPTSYLWLTTTQPGLIREELTKSYESGADKIWLMNVGDLKPAEKEIDFYTKLARNVGGMNSKDIAETYIQNAKRDFNMDDTDAAEYASIMDEFYELANSKRPEFMRTGDFSVTAYGDEGQRYIDRYTAITERVEALYNKLPQSKKTSFYEMAVYPVRSAKNMAIAYIANDCAKLYNEQQRGSVVNRYAKQSEDAAAAIEKELTTYNSLLDGKWNNIANINPSALQGCDAHISTYLNPPTVSELDYTEMGIAVDTQSDINSEPQLALSKYDTDSKFIDIFNKGYGSFDYRVSADKNYIKINKTEGTVYDSDRIYVSLDVEAAPEGTSEATITVERLVGSVTAESKNIKVSVSNIADMTQDKTYIEASGYVSIEAEHYSSLANKGEYEWRVEKDFGRSGDSLKIYPTLASDVSESNIKSVAAYSEYNVYFENSGTYTLDVYRMPTLNERGSMKFAVGIDDTNPKVFSGTNKYSGSSSKTDAWAKGVLCNSEKLSTTVNVPTAGLHTVRLYNVSAGTVIDKMVLTHGTTVPYSYFGAPESYNTSYNKVTAELPQASTTVAPQGNITKVFEPDVMVGRVVTTENTVTAAEIIKLTDNQSEVVAALKSYKADGNMNGITLKKVDLSNVDVNSAVNVDFDAAIPTDTASYEITVFDNFTNVNIVAPYKTFGKTVTEGEGKTIGIKADLSEYTGKKSMVLVADTEITEDITADHIVYMHGENVDKNSYKFIPFDKAEGVYYIRGNVQDGEVFNEKKSTIINIHPDNNGIVKQSNTWSFDGTLTDANGKNAFVLSGEAINDVDKIKLNTTSTGSAKMTYENPVSILSGETVTAEFDIYFGKLTKKSVSYALADSNGSTIAGMTIGIYDSNFSCKIGGSDVTLDNSAVAAVVSGLSNEAKDNTPVHFKNEIDFATGKVNITLSRSGKSNAVISGRLGTGILSNIGSLEFTTNYNNDARACRVDNASININTAPQYEITVGAYKAASREETVDGASITVKDKATGTVVTPADGKYMLCEGDYIITVTADGYREKETVLELSPALESKNVKVYMQSLSDITSAKVTIEFKDTDGGTVKDSVNVEDYYIGDEYSVPEEYGKDIIDDSGETTVIYTYLPMQSTLSSDSLAAENTFTVMFKKTVKTNAKVTINYVDEENNVIKDAVTPDGKYYTGDSYTVPANLTADFRLKGENGKYNLYEFNESRSQTSATLTEDTQITLVYNLTGQYDYYENFEGYTVDNSAWKLGSGSAYPTVAGDDNGSYLNFASSGSTIGAYTTFDEIDCTNKKVSIKADIRFSPKGTVGNSQFTIGNAAPSFDGNNINYGITGKSGNAAGHIIGFEYNTGTTFLVNGRTLDTSLITKWIHVDATADFAAKTVTIKLTTDDGDSAEFTDINFYSSSAANNIGSMYVRAAKANGKVDVDNLEINIIGDGTPGEASPLNSKTVYAFGDSIVYGHNDPSNAFMNLIANKYNMFLTKGAKNGATVIDSSNDVIAQVNNAPAAAPDFVVFEGYTNDAYGDPATDSFNTGNAADVTKILGEAQGSTATTFDNKTFCGAFEELIYTMKQKWPTSKLVFVTIHKSGARDFAIQTTLHDLTVEMCNEWGVEVVDMFKDATLDTRDSAQMAKYIIGGKGSHPNVVCCEEFYVPMISAKLIELAETE